MSCPAVHPGVADVRCQLPAGNHPWHQASEPGNPPVHHSWINEGYAAPQPEQSPEQKKAKRTELATKISAGINAHEIAKLNLARTGDPDTSHLSAEATKDTIGQALWEALVALSEPMTDVQVLAKLRAAGVQITDRGPSKRLGDLDHKFGLVEDTGQRVYNPVTKRQIMIRARTAAGDALVRGESR